MGRPYKKDACGLFVLKKASIYADLRPVEELKKLLLQKRCHSDQLSFTNSVARPLHSEFAKNLLLNESPTFLSLCIILQTQKQI